MVVHCKCMVVHCKCLMVHCKCVVVDCKCVVVHFKCVVVDCKGVMVYTVKVWWYTLYRYLQTARYRSVAMPMIRKVVQDIRMFFRGYQKYGNMYPYV